METIKAENIVKRYENHLALDDVSISNSQANVLGLLGPNGAGKTTLIRIINQIIAPDSGRVFINGENLSQKHINQIGYLPEERGLYKKMKVGEQAVYLSCLKGMSKSDVTRETKRWLEKFEIGAWYDKNVEELSKGMQQKIQFIITVIHKPKILIFDEPFSGFDPINSNLLKKEILELKEQSASIIFSTHNMSSVEEVCDNVVLINNSKKIIDGTVEYIRNLHSIDKFEIEYTGNFNKLEATLCSDYRITDLNENSIRATINLELINKNITSNQLLERMLQYGNITSFQRHLPSMNEIFIKLIGQTSNTKNNE